MMQDHMAQIGGEFLAKEPYYNKFGITVDDRGRLAGLVGQLYDRQRQGCVE